MVNCQALSVYTTKGKKGGSEEAVTASMQKAVQEAVKTEEQIVIWDML